jgi:TP901 family phage tail tape measure protein
MATKALTYKIGMDIGELRRNAEAAGTYTRGFKKELQDLKAKQEAHRKTLTDLGKGMATFGAATLAGLGIAAKAAIDWETAWTGVRKTVDGSDQEMAALEHELRGLAKTLPSSHKEIAAVAAAAGQLGIKRKDIAAFTKTMIDLGETTNLTAEEAATDLAKFSNIMGTSASDVDKLGSTLVALGNDGASTEKDIIEMGLRIAGAGKQLKLTESQVLGFSSALTSMGILAEGGGSSISTTMVAISKAVNTGGSKLDAFAKVAGMTGAQFKQSFQQDAGAAITKFIVGLGKMQDSGGDVFATLQDLGLETNEIRDTLLRAAGGSDLFTRSLRVGSTAWAENSALTAEANKRYETAASKMKVAWNQIQDALIDVGAAVVPLVSGLTGGIAEIVRGFQALPGPIKDVITWAGLGAGAVALFGGAALIAVPKILAFRESMTAMGAAGGAATSALSKFGLFMTGPWGAAIIGGVVLLTSLVGQFGAVEQKQQAAAAAGKALADVLREQGGIINKTVIEAAAKAAADDGMLTKARQLGIESGKVTDAILGQGDAYTELRDQLIGMLPHADEMRSAYLNMVEGGKLAGESGEVFTGVLSEEEKVIVGLLMKLHEKHASFEKGVEDNRAITEATKKATDASKEQAQATGKTTKELEEEKKAFDGVQKSLDTMNGTVLSARASERDFRDSVTDAYEAMREQMSTLDENGVALGNRARTLDQDTASGRKNAEMLDKIAESAGGMAKRIGEQTTAQQGAAAGAEAMNNSLEASRRILIDAAMFFGMTAEEARKYADQALRIPEIPPILVTTPGSKEAFAELSRVNEALKRGATAQQNFNLQLSKTGPVAKTAKEMLDDLVTALDAMNETSLSSRDARRRQLQAIEDAKTGLKDQMEALDVNDVAFGERARTLDEHTDMGRKNAAMLDDQARAALDLAKAVAREAEANGGAAAGQAALIASLKASRPALIETAKMFGMNQAQAEAYANDVLAIPKVSSVKVSTPGSKESQTELQRVKDKADAIPGEKWVNVGVISKTAQLELEKLGFKVQTLPNGIVYVQAPTDYPQRQLDDFINRNQNRVINIRGTIEQFYQGQGGRYYAGYARGGIVSFASGGMYEDHRPQIANARAGMVRQWAEPETGRESYIPWAADRRREATGVLRTTAHGFGYDLVPVSIPVRSFANGGISGGAGSGGAAHVHLHVTGGDTDAAQFIATMIRKYARVTGSGDVQRTFGQRY